MTRRIILPDWVDKLRKRYDEMENELHKMKDEIIELRKMVMRLSQIPDDLKSLKELVAEKCEYAQGLPTPNIPIIAKNTDVPILAGVPKRRLTPGEHQRKSIHAPTFSYESKITTIAKNVDPNI